MDDEDHFHLQLSKSLQAWLWIEAELYALYAMLMQGANKHLVSATFNNIQSIDSKIYLLDSCFTLVFGRDSQYQKEWKALSNKVVKLNKQRNKIVHEPMSILHERGTRTVSIGPSHMNAMALVKGQTTHKGGPVTSVTYDPKGAKLLQAHRIDLKGMVALEQGFKSVSTELLVFRDKVSPMVAAAVKVANSVSRSNK